MEMEVGAHTFVIPLVWSVLRGIDVDIEEVLQKKKQFRLSSVDMAKYGEWY